MQFIHDPLIKEGQGFLLRRPLLLIFVGLVRDNFRWRSDALRIDRVHLVEVEHFEKFVEVVQHSVLDGILRCAKLLNIIRKLCISVLIRLVYILDKILKHLPVKDSVEAHECQYMQLLAQLVILEVVLVVGDEIVDDAQPILVEVYLLFCRASK